MAKNAKRDPRLSYGPSARHVWYVKSQNVDKCRRCDCSYIRSGGGTSPWYCFPSKEWIASNPEDDLATH